MLPLSRSKRRRQFRCDHLELFNATSLLTTSEPTDASEITIFSFIRPWSVSRERAKTVQGQEHRTYWEQLREMRLGLVRLEETREESRETLWLSITA